MSNTKAATYACGVKAMLLDAIHRHRREHFGDLPKRVVLHPAVRRDLLLELDAGWLHEFASGPPESFMGVPVECERIPQGAKLIDRNNVVVYL